MILAWFNGARWRETQETYFVRVASEAEADEVEALARPLMEGSYRVGLFQEVAPMKADLVKTPEEFLLAVWAGHNPSCPDYSDGDGMACTCERAAAMQWIARRSGAGKPAEPECRYTLAEAVAALRTSYEAHFDEPLSGPVETDDVVAAFEKRLRAEDPERYERLKNGDWDGGGSGS